MLIKRIIPLLLSLFVQMNAMMAIESTTVIADKTIKGADNPKFITASLLVISPGKQVYSIMGHSAIRMQCPSKGLDYCFTFEMAPGAWEYAEFFSGNSDAGFVSAPTAIFIQQYRDEGRGITEYCLNLSPAEKQELWRILDNKVADGATYKFDYMTTSCSAMCTNTVIEALGRDEIAYGKMPSELHGTYRNVLREMPLHSPWSEIFWNLTMGTDGDSKSDLNGMMAPSLLAQAWSKAAIKDTAGATRPMIIGTPKELLSTVNADEPLPVTPIMASSLLLIWTIAITITQRYGKFIKTAKATDGVLLAIQTLVGLWITFLLLFSHLSATTWNWYVIPFNPLPIILWMNVRHKTIYRKLHFVYAVVLIVFLAVTPLVPQSEWALQLFIAALAVRSANNFLIINKPYSQKKVKL
jgi:hypothetical protein